MLAREDGSGVIQYYLGHVQLENSIVYLHVRHVALAPRLRRLAPRR